MSKSPRRSVGCASMISTAGRRRDLDRVAEALADRDRALLDVPVHRDRRRRRRHGDRRRRRRRRRRARRPRPASTDAASAARAELITVAAPACGRSAATPRCTAGRSTTMIASTSAARSQRSRAVRAGGRARGERLADARVAGVDDVALAGLGLLELDEPDVGQLALARIVEHDRDDVVAARGDRGARARRRRRGSRRRRRRRERRLRHVAQVLERRGEVGAAPGGLAATAPRG